MQKEEINHEDEIDRILKDPKKYRKMMLIMQQALYDLGYHESAKMLESQSGVNFYSPQLLSIKELLEKDDFESAIKVVQQLQKNSLQQNGIQREKMNGSKNRQSNITKLSLHTLSETKMMIYETYCMHKIINQEFQSAMQIISQNIKSQAKKQFLCQALVLGNHHLSKEQLQKKKQGIFKYCLSSWQQIGDKQIERVIESYRQHEGEFINREMKSLLSQQKLLPPMRVYSIQLQKSIKHTITHMRISTQLNTLYLIQQDKDVLNVHLITIDDKKLQCMSYNVGEEMSRNKGVFAERMTKSLEMKYKGKRQSVESIAVNPNAEISNIDLAICSFNVIMMLGSNLDVISQIQTTNKIEKYLHIEFHPISQLLYTCGYFQTLNAIDSQGQLIQSLYPYPKTRKFLFSDNSHTLGISLVTNRVYRHSLDEQVLEKQVQLDDGVMPMDICVSNYKGPYGGKVSKMGYSSVGTMISNNINSNNSKLNTTDTRQQYYIGVSSLQFIYILDNKTLNILGKTISPTNPNKLIVEVKFFDDYLISLAKNFTAYTIEGDVGKSGMKDEGVHVNGSEKVSIKDNSMQQVQMISINKYRQWSGQGTFLLISNNFMLSASKQITLWYPGNLQSPQMIDQSQQQLLEDNNNMMIVQEIQGMISYSESQNDSSSSQSNEMEEDDNNGQEGEWNEDDSGDSGMEMM